MNGPIDAELLGRLLDEHGSALALYASQWTDAADDCVQEALVELARQREAPEHVVAWLYRVVKHRALNAARGARRRREREARVMADRFAASQQPAAFDRADTMAVIEALDALGGERSRNHCDADLGRFDVRRNRGGADHIDIERSSAIRASAHQPSTDIGVAMFGKREPERTELTPELAALERQLSALAITPPRIDRDKLMFEAGRAAASRPRWSINLAGPPWGGSRVWPARHRDDDRSVGIVGDDVNSAT